jgi:hypothetical protein
MPCRIKAAAADSAQGYAPAMASARELQPTSIAKRTPSRPKPLSFTPPYGM